jgi:hypothetical protein
MENVMQEPKSICLLPEHYTKSVTKRSSSQFRDRGFPSNVTVRRHSGLCVPWLSNDWLPFNPLTEDGMAEMEGPSLGATLYSFRPTVTRISFDRSQLSDVSGSHEISFKLKGVSGSTGWRVHPEIQMSDKFLRSFSEKAKLPYQQLLFTPL